MLPDLNTKVEIIQFDQQGEIRERWPSRIENIEGSQAWIAAPVIPNVEFLPEPGMMFHLGWVAPRGIVHVPVKLLTIQRDQNLKLWQLTVLQQPVVYNQRRYFRAQIAARASLIRTDKPNQPTPVLNGHLVEISEGGARIALPKTEGLTSDTPVQLFVELETGHIKPKARIVQVGVADDTGFTPVSMEFLEETYGRTIREAVFRAQVRSRKLEQEKLEQEQLLEGLHD